MDAGESKQHVAAMASPGLSERCSEFAYEVPSCSYPFREKGKPLTSRHNASNVKVINNHCTTAEKH